MMHLPSQRSLMENAPSRPGLSPSDRTNGETRCASIEKILAEIDAKTNRLQTVKTLLAPSSAPPKRGAGRLAQSKSPTSGFTNPKRRKMNRAARKKIRQAQLKRWADKKTAKAPAKKTAA